MKCQERRTSIQTIAYIVITLLRNILARTHNSHLFNATILSHRQLQVANIGMGSVCVC